MRPAAAARPAGAATPRTRPPSPSDEARSTRSARTGRLQSGPRAEKMVELHLPGLHETAKVVLSELLERTVAMIADRGVGVGDTGGGVGMVGAGGGVVGAGVVGVGTGIAGAPGAVSIACSMQVKGIRNTIILIILFIICSP